MIRKKQKQHQETINWVFFYCIDNDESYDTLKIYFPFLIEEI